MINNPPVPYNGTRNESKLLKYIRIISWANLIIGWLGGAGFTTEFQNPIFAFLGIILGAISAVAWRALAVIVEACDKYLTSK